jgi:phosphomannomutase
MGTSLAMEPLVNKALVAFDLDDTLAITKSPISPRMSELLGALLERFQVCVITGGTFEQIKKQVISNLAVDQSALVNLHVMPTCGTRYYRFVDGEWAVQYAEDLTDEQRRQIVAVLEEGSRSLGLWEEDPAGEIIEDRGSQITYSALGQLATPDAKYAWDPDRSKKESLRAYTAERLPDFEVRVGGTTSVDITNIGVDKAHGMRKLMEALSLTEADILFVGDKLMEGGNDYPVKAMGIDSIAVEGWEDTAFVIEGINAITRVP